MLLGGVNGRTNQTKSTVHGTGSVVVITSVRITEDPGSVPDRACSCYVFVRLVISLFSNNLNIPHQFTKKHLRLACFEIYTVWFSFTSEKWASPNFRFVFPISLPLATASSKRIRGAGNPNSSRSQHQRQPQFQTILQLSRFSCQMNIFERRTKTAMRCCISDI